MSIQRVALVFDNSLRPETTGLYCRRALGCLVEVEHFLPSELGAIPRGQFDLFLRVDDGLDYEMPAGLGPWAFWAIDTHVDYERILKAARAARFVFSAQKNGAERLRAAGVEATWLPLACDPEIHRPYAGAKQFDFCFVGNLVGRTRGELISALRQQFPRTFVGRRYFEEMAWTYSVSRVVFNCSVADDLNMRVFEALACEGFLLTNEVGENGQQELFRDGVHLAVYRDREELLDEAAFYMERDNLRERIAQAGRGTVLSGHTYLHRMTSLLRSIERQLTRTQMAVPGRPAAGLREPEPEAQSKPQVSACLVSWKRPDNVRRIVEALRSSPFIDDILVWNNDPANPLVIDVHGVTVIDSPENLITLGRYECTRRARHEIIYTQDDDCLVHNLAELYETFRLDPTRIAHNLKLGHLVRNADGVFGEAQIALVGWGAFFHRDWIAVLDEYRMYFGDDRLLRREADRLFSLLLDRRHRPLPAQLTDLPGADGPEALSVEPDHPGLAHEAICRALAVLEQRRGRRPEQGAGIAATVPRTEPSADLERQHAPPAAEPQPVKDPSYFEHARPELLALVPLTSCHVLDVGCGAGRLGEALKARQPAHVTGIELNPAAVAAAQTRIDEVVAADAQDERTAFSEGRFDCIIFADILEHLDQPLRVLRNARRWLAPDGVLVASIPNIQHHTIIEALLGGSFTYEPAGLLDHDHCRFFTRREIEKLFFRAGFRIESIEAKPTPDYFERQTAGPGDSVPIGRLRLQGIRNDQILALHTYQYLVRAVRTDVPRYELSSVVVVTHNALEHTRRCLAALRRYTDEPFELIVVDNASTDGTLEYLGSQPGVRLIANPTNRGFPAAANQGIQAAQGENILLLNNDVIVTTGWLRRLLDALHSDPRLGLVGPCTNSTAGPQRRPLQYPLERLDDMAWDWSQMHQGRLVDADALMGFCLLIRRDVLTQIGMLDEQFGLGTYEDVDLCRRAVEAGYRLAIAEDVWVHHAGHASFEAAGLNQDLLAVESEQKYRAKWGLGPHVAALRVSSDLQGGGRPSGMPLPQPISERRTASDHLADRLPAGVNSALVVAHDPGDLSHRIGRAGCHTVTLSPNDALPSEQFAAAIVWLEDLRSPADWLRKLRSRLDAEGLVLAAASNRRHHGAVAALLDGTWTGSSLLRPEADPRTFFTRSELEKVFFRAGFDVQSLEPISDGTASSPDSSDTITVGPLVINDVEPGDADEFFTSGFVVSARPAQRIEHGLTSIVILTHNELTYTRQCLDSIRFITDEPYELILVDNASTDGTVEYLRSLGGITLIENAENRGFPAAANQGIQAAQGEHILLLNNDVIVTTGWLRRLLDALHSHPRIGLAGPLSNNVSGEQQIPVEYQSLAELDGFAWRLARRNRTRRSETDRLVGFCLLAKREVIDRIGMLDEQFGIGCFEDDDFCRRALAAGYRLVIAEDSFVHHFGSRTFQSSGVDFAGVMAENQRKFVRKWAPEPSEPSRAPVASQPLPVSPSLKPPLAEPPPVVGAQRPVYRLEAGRNGGLVLRDNDIRLSLCMIVRDNESTIEACLKSIRPWVDEMVVVDTGSTDRTPEICRTLGARVFRFPWCDDFSAARNESVRHARGEWIFWMDSDDTIDEANGRKLRALADRRHPDELLGFVMQVHCPAPSSDGRREVTAVDHLKLFRNRPDLRFEHRIHEQIIPAIRRGGGDVAATDVFVVHSGADHTPEGRQRKLARDLRILKQDLEERPDHPFVLFNFGMTYNDAGQHEQAVECLRRCLSVSTPQESHLRKAYAFLAQSLAQLERTEEALAVCEEGLGHYPDDKELLYRAAMLQHELRRFDEAERLYLRVLNDTEEWHFSSIDLDLAGYKARHNLARVYEDMGRHDAAECQWRQILVEQPDYRPGWRALGESLVARGDSERHAALIEQLRKHAQLHPLGAVLAASAARQRNDLAEARQQLESAAQKFPRDIEVLSELCRLLFECFDPAEAEEPLGRLAEITPEDASVHHNLGTVCRRLARLEEAVHHFERSLELRPRSPKTAIELERARSELRLRSQAREAMRPARSPLVQHREPGRMPRSQPRKPSEHTAG